MEKIKRFLDRHKITDKKIIIMLVILSIVLTALPILVRSLSNEPPIMGRESYYHLGVAKNLFLDGKFSDTEELASLGMSKFQQTSSHYNVFHLLLYFFLVFMREKTAAFILPLLIGLLSTIFLYTFLRKNGLDKAHSILAMGAFMLSNTFIVAFTTINQEGFAFLLMLLGFHLFYGKQKWKKVMSIIIFLVLCTFSAFNSLLIIILALTLIKFRKPDKKHLIISIISIVVFSSILRLPFAFHFNYSLGRQIVQLMSDIGGLMGFGFFSIMLALVGFVVSWKIRKKIYPLYFLFIALIISFFFADPSMLIYPLVIIAISASKAVIELVNLKWAINVVRGLTLILIICGFLFSAVATIRQTPSIPPSYDDVKSLELFGAMKSKHGAVFSDIQNSFWIQGITDSKVFLAPISRPASNFKDSLDKYDKIIHASNLKELKATLDQTDIKYFWINKNMKKELWDGERKELLFLFSNNETFKNIYNEDGIEAWEYIGKFYNVQ